MAITGLESSHSLRPQFPTLKNYSSQTLKHLPYAITEQGLAMLSGILNRDRAININIAIMLAFLEIRRLSLQQMNIR